MDGFGRRIVFCCKLFFNLLPCLGLFLVADSLDTLTLGSSHHMINFALVPLLLAKMGTKEEKLNAFS